MIERALASYFNGEGKVDYLPDGVVFTLRAPLEASTTKADACSSTLFTHNRVGHIKAAQYDDKRHFRSLEHCQKADLERQPVDPL
ncbi:hypothetical protein ACXIUS_19435 [Bosea thiooxidans]